MKDKPTLQRVWVPGQRVWVVDHGWATVVHDIGQESSFDWGVIVRFSNGEERSFRHWEIRLTKERP